MARGLTSRHFVDSLHVSGLEHFQTTTGSLIVTTALG